MPIPSLQDLSKAGFSFKNKKMLTHNALLFVYRSLNVEKKKARDPRRPGIKNIFQHKDIPRNTIHIT